MSSSGSFPEIETGQPVKRSKVTIPPLMGAGTVEEEDHAPIEVVLKRIFTEVLGIQLKSAYDDQFIECLYKLKKNFIHTLGKLFRLPSSRAIEKLDLPLLVETQFVNLYCVHSRFSEQPATTRSTHSIEFQNSPLSASANASTASPHSAGSQKSAVFGLTDETRLAIKQNWSEISSQRGTASLLNQLFEYVLPSLHSPNEVKYWTNELLFLQQFGKRNRCYWRPRSHDSR